MKLILKEAVYGSLATVFHRSKTNNKTSFKVFPGNKRTGVALFGGGFYTTYDIEDQLKDRMIKNYGEYIFKIVVRVDKFFFMDKHLRQQASAKYDVKQKNAVKRIEEIVSEDSDFNQWLDDGYSIYVVNKYSEVDELIREHFEGIIYTSKDDGRCALIFNPVKTYTKVVSVAHVPDWNVDAKKIEWKKI